jgi:hypothetical protein
MHPAPPTPADRLSALIVRLVSAVFARRVGAHLGFVPATLVTLFSDRLRAVNQRFRRLAARIQAGWVDPPKPATPRPAPAKPPADKPPRETSEKPDLSFAKFTCQMPQIPGYDLETIARDFRQLLADPAMQAVMAAAPGPAWRILRSLCRMTGTPRPDILAPPPRPPRPKASRPKASKPKRAGRRKAKAPKTSKPAMQDLWPRMPSAHWPPGVLDRPRKTR